MVGFVWFWLIVARGGCPLVSVQEVCHRLIVVCLGFEGPPVDGLRELLLRSRRGRQVPPFGEDLCFVDVGVVAGHLVSVRLVCFSLQAGGSEATVPCASLPSVTLGTAAVVGVGVHQVIVLPLDRGKGCQGVGDDFRVGHLGLGHWSRFVWYALVYTAQVW